MAEPAPTVPAPAPGPIQGLKLWQALLLYPALISTILAAVPTVWNEVKAWQHGVASSQLQLVQEQDRLWRSNLECLTAQGTYEIDGPDGVVVRVTLCPKTADMLVRYHLGDWTPIFKWVGRPRMEKGS